MLFEIWSLHYNYHASLHICADKDERKIFVELKWTLPDMSMTKIFPAEEYGKALDEYKVICAQVKSRFRADKKKRNV